MSRTTVHAAYFLYKHAPFLMSLGKRKIYNYMPKIFTFLACAHYENRKCMKQHSEPNWFSKPNQVQKHIEPKPIFWAKFHTPDISKLIYNDKIMNLWHYFYSMTLIWAKAYILFNILNNRANNHIHRQIQYSDIQFIYILLS